MTQYEIKLSKPIAQYTTRSASDFRQIWFLDQFITWHNGFICGGCFKNIFNGEKIKDVDIFFRSEDDERAAEHYYDTMTDGYRGEDAREEQYRFCYENSNVKSYVHIKSGIRIELCRKIFGTPAFILNNFDFSITKFAYYKIEISDNKSKANEGTTEFYVLYDDRFFEDLHLHRIVIDGDIPYPMSTLERMFRYAKYGYSPCRETKMKIVRALRDLSEEAVIVSESLYDGID